MRNIERLLLFLYLPLLLWPWLPASQSLLWLPIVGVLFLLLHVIFERHRWQMVPLYLLITFELYFALNCFPNQCKAWPWWASVLGLVAWFTSLVLGGVLPVPSLPKPSGPFGIGTVKFHLIDDQRKEIYSGNPNDLRELVVQVWYPRDKKAGGQRAPWIEGTKKFSAFALKIIHYPGFLMDHLVLAKSHSIQDAPLSSEQSNYPVILFSHGFTGFMEQNIAQMEELASHGYVVMAPSHTYWSLATVFPDGRVILPDPDAFPRDAKPDELMQAFNRVVRQWQADLKFVLDHFEHLNQHDPAGRFTQRLDMERVGVMGHSTGGGAALEFSSSDKRCKALLAMDLWSEPVSDEVIEAGVDIPTLLMFSETWNSSIDLSITYRRLAQMMENLKAPGYQLTIAGTKHQDLTTMTFLSPVMARYLRFRGSVNPRRAMKIVNTYVVAFFDKYIQVQDTNLLDTGSVYFPEVSYAAPII
ncbi:MAG: hypothetical protein DWQ07_04805 [Chloroflexi bacterium]|nr:MAG: hypothetical protein DWQ07_04805 [Chloroflexota bacterium]MBL1194751.1 hypothetical protein [Chloroflexota bacterium]NOH12043.1 hypothetical protein [Chloroflexota bacterium]